MLNMSRKSEEFLKENLPEVINMKDTTAALDAISTWMQIYGFDSNDDINEPGREAERVYDDIYIHND